MPRHVKTNAEWEAENDADTLANAIAIKLDKERLAKAAKAAKRVAKTKTDEAVGMRRVSRMGKKR